MDNPISEPIKNKTYKRPFYNEFNVSQVKRRTFPKIYAIQCLKTVYLFKIAKRNELNSNLKHGPSVLICCHYFTAEANIYKMAGWL